MLKENLNELNIFALRDLARKTGVASPTSKKKEDLIKEIVEIVSGKKEPQMKTKQGRPPKTFGYSFSNLFDFGSVQTLNQKIENSSGCETATVAGWLELVNNNSALLWVEKDLRNVNYFVPNETLKNVEVKMGDRAVAEILSDGSTNVVQKIFSINDCPINQMEKNRLDYSNVQHVFPTKKLTFKKKEYNNLNILLGENVYFYGENNNNNTKSIVDMLMNCEVQNKLYLNVSLAEKNKLFLSNLKTCENFVCNLTDDADVVRRLISLSIERAKRILECGEDCVIVVDDINSISAIEKDGFRLIKNLVTLTKNCDKGSITLLAIIPDRNQNSIEKLADKRFVINGEKIN